MPTAPIPPPPPKPSSRESDRAKVMEDDLGKLVSQNVEQLRAIGWTRLHRKLRGRGDLRLQPLAASHPAYPLLLRLQHEGAPAVMSSQPWSRSKLNKHIRRGSHKSCQEHLDFLREELLDFSRKGFWLVLPYRVVRQLQKMGHLIGLRVSPMGVVPQRNRRPRIIVDLSFHGVNSDTFSFAPKEAMQFG